MNQVTSEELIKWLTTELSEIKSLINEKKQPYVTKDWIPRSLVEEFFDYGDTQMTSFEKTHGLVVSKVGRRKFFHRASIEKLLEQNVIAKSD